MGQSRTKTNVSPCPHYPRCVGCPFIGLPYDKQLLRKRERIERCFARYPSLAHLEVPPVNPSPYRLGYRGRVKLVVRRSRGEVAMGLYLPGTHRVSDISSCPIHPPAVQRVTRRLKDKILELGVAPYDERIDSGQLRFVDFRYSFARRKLCVTLVTRHRDFPQGVTLAHALMRKFSFVSGVVQNINEEPGNVIWGERYRLLAGRDDLVEQIGSLKLGFPAGVFSQGNPGAAKNLYDKVREMAGLTGREKVLDLYCGVGPISLYLAGAARLVWGIDESSLSIDAAKHNASRNGVSNCRFFAGEIARRIREAKSELGSIPCIVVNPPRKGVQPAALETILGADAGRIVYVSCEPESLSRDLDRLVSHGYRLLRLQPLDMFPHTTQVETVVLLEKSSTKRT